MKEKFHCISPPLRKRIGKTNQTEFRVEKVLNKKFNELYAKWKVYDISFFTWIHKKDIVV